VTLASRLPEYPWDELDPIAEKARAFPGGAVDLSIGTPVDPVPSIIQDALVAAANAPGYPLTAGTPELRSAAAGWLARSLGVQVDPGTVLPVIGTKEFIAWLPVMLGLGSADTVIYPSLAYPTYDIGARLAGLLEAIGMHVVAWTLHRDPARLTSHAQRFVELRELLETADLVSLHLLLTDETRGMIDESALRSLKPGALLVNTARAELIAPGALERVLAEGRIAAALDVFETEPLAVGSALRDLPNVILSPHQGYNTPESLERMLDVVVANIEHYLSGTPANIVSAPRRLFAIGNYVPFS